ncbi:FAD-dependent oxidoreductase [Candidatus Peregrinibacteria bacterium]|nr:FAD-dependent oxidoreductase [Candidatus Peregrinibacteria bacterium]
MINSAKVVQNITLTHDVFELTLETKSDFSFTAGQFINVKINDGAPPCFRGYSIASKPEDNNQFRLCIKKIDGGRGSTWLQSLKNDAEITFLGPIGKLTLNPSNKKVIFVATGTGVAPFAGIIEEALLKGNNQEMALYFGLRHEKDIFYRAKFEELAQKYRNFKFNLTLSRPENPDFKGHIGRVTSMLDELTIDPENTEIFICGLKDMLQEVNSIFLGKGMKPENIHLEQYD